MLAENAYLQLYGWLWILMLCLMVERRRSLLLGWLILCALSVVAQSFINGPGPNDFYPTAPGAIMVGLELWLVFKVVTLGISLIPVLGERKKR